MKTASWVIRHKETGRVIGEVYRRSLIRRLNPAYEAVPILEYLQSLNKAARK